MALGGVDLQVERGELLGLLGPNGAGKSTLTKIACGLVRATGGRAEVEGARAGSATARAAIGYLAELFRFPDWLTAEELIALHQDLAGSDGGTAERGELLELVGLAEARKVKVAAMSKGMQQRLGIAQALVGSPRLLMLDEPTSALDPVGRRVVRDLLRELRAPRRGGRAQLAPSQRGRAGVRPRGDPGGWPDRGERARRLSSRAREGWRSRRVAASAASGKPRARTCRGSWPSSCRGGEQVYGVSLLASTLEDAYLEAVGAA